jgi:folate-dependent phosphoribosylglycinamide formyltransferase PurN
MRVLGLCSGVPKAYQLDRSLNHVNGIATSFLIPNPRRLPLPRLIAGLVSGALRAGPCACVWALRALRQQRLLISRRDLEDPRLLGRVRAFAPDVGVHGVGVIYRQPLLECFRLGILNAHIGVLPKYRGRSVMEWALLNGDETGVTTFLIDEGIDTGPIVLRRGVDVSGKGSVAEAKRYLFSLDGEMYAEALALLQSPDFKPVPQDAESGTRWYAMSQLLTGAVEDILRGRPREGGESSGEKCNLTPR